MLDITTQINTPITVFVCQLDGRNCYMENSTALTNTITTDTPDTTTDTHHYIIRWFTPSGEVPLCGHGTLGAAYVLYQSAKLVPTTRSIQFHTMNNDILSVSYDTEPTITDTTDTTSMTSMTSMKSATAPLTMEFPAIPTISNNNPDITNMFAKCLNIDVNTIIQINTNITTITNSTNTTTANESTNESTPATPPSKYIIELSNEAYYQVYTNQLAINTNTHILSQDVLGFIITTTGTYTTTGTNKKEYINNNFDSRYNFISAYYYRRYISM